MKFDADPTVLIAMDLFARRPGDARGLAANDARLGVDLLRPEGHCFGDALEGVAIALGKLVELRRLAGAALFFQHLRLFAFMVNVGQQPTAIPGGVFMLAQGQKVATAQARLIAAATGQSVAGLVMLQRALAQPFAVGFLLEAAGVSVVLKHALLALEMAVGFQRAAGFLEVVVAAHDVIGADFQPQLEAVD